MSCQVFQVWRAQKGPKGMKDPQVIKGNVERMGFLWVDEKEWMDLLELKDLKEYKEKLDQEDPKVMLLSYCHGSPSLN